VAVEVIILPGFVTAVYDVIGAPPLLLALYVIVILVPLLATAVPIVGACGTYVLDVVAPHPLTNVSVTVENTRT
jgi:hypothetical protein